MYMEIISIEIFAINFYNKCKGAFFMRIINVKNIKEKYFNYVYEIYSNKINWRKKCIIKK